jgi:hypothetical protein
MTKTTYNRSAMRTTLRVTLALGFALSSGTALAKDKKKKHGGGDPGIAEPLPDQPKADPNALHSLTVLGQPAGADVFVDGQRIGQTPIDLPVPVTAGEHSIKVAKLGFAPYIDVFSAKKQKVVKLEIELVPVSGVVHVTSTVAESRVLIDGRFVGAASPGKPLDVEMEVGARAIQVEKGCYKEFFQNLLAVAGKEETVDVKLEELPQNETNPCYVKPLPPPKWYQKRWVWGVIAGVAAVGAGGAVTGAVLATRNNDPLAEADLVLKIQGLSVPF